MRCPLNLVCPMTNAFTRLCGDSDVDDDDDDDDHHHHNDDAPQAGSVNG